MMPAAFGLDFGMKSMSYVMYTVSGVGRRSWIMWFINHSSDVLYSQP